VDLFSFCFTYPDLHHGLLGGVLRDLLFGVGATNPMAYIIVPALFILVALLASYVPARRAARVNPMVALRYE
jgi:putative ABC transport system permease protein